VVERGAPQGLVGQGFDERHERRTATSASTSVSITSDAGSAQQTITLVNGTIKEVVFSLPQSKAPLGGWVTVASPFPVDVIERGEVVGTSGTARTMLTAGSQPDANRPDESADPARIHMAADSGVVAPVVAG
jgi:hypothetical protein